MSNAQSDQIGGNIKSLDKSTVHRICSGQVIINLANAVKELIENSLDAGAKTVEIRLKNYGSEMIEVIDDGPGIDEADFQTITLKHYTSKIQRFDDLESLGTFGFRGEALSSLCSLSNLTIITRSASSNKATRIEYDQNGIIKLKQSCARSVGTTIQLEKLFHSLPVRHKEFTKNLKREYHKLMYVVQSYCLISEGIKLSCFHIQGDKSTKLMSTQLKNNLKSNIIEIFGSNAMSNMVEFEQTEPDSEILIDFKISKPPNKLLETEELNPDQPTPPTNESDLYSSMFKIEGYISDCGHNNGRSAADRQYIYVNKRPCDHSKLTKLINEIFHQFNRNQYPMFVLNIIMDSRNVDVNVTPDKLQMFFKNENILLAIVKSSLIKMYSKLYKNINLDESSFQSQKSNAKILTYFSPKVTNETKKSNLVIQNENQPSSEEELEPEPEKIEKKRPRKESTSDSNTSLGSPSTPQVSKQPKLRSPNTTATSQNKSNLPFFQPKFFLHEISKKKPESSNDTSSNQIETTDHVTSGALCLKDKINLFHNRIGASHNDSVASDLNESIAEKIDLHLCNRQTAMLDTPPAGAVVSRIRRNKPIDEEEDNVSMLDESTLVSNLPIKSTKKTETPNIIDETCEIDQSTQILPKVQKSQNKTQINNTLTSTFDSIAKRKTKVLEFTLANFFKDQREIIDYLREQSEEDKIKKEKEMIRNVKFKTKNIESKEAETELDRCMTKSDFLRMKACGQFNKGFIVGELDSDLFIVDQHAADEIYNFEMLQRGGKIEKQKLLQPKYLELSPSAEHILIENISFLEKSGYEMQICSNRKIGNQIMVTCVPMSAQGNKILNLKDIDELIFILSENDLNSGSISTSSSEKSNITDGIKSSSLRAFYASKACRKSIMIGDSLNMKEMKRVINHLSEIDKPWNCPHGRPTMRHLININLLKKAWQN